MSADPAAVPPEVAFAPGTDSADAARWTNATDRPIPDPHGNGVRIGEAGTPAQYGARSRRLPAPGDRARTEAPPPHPATAIDPPGLANEVPGSSVGMRSSALHLDGEESRGLQLITTATRWSRIAARANQAPPPAERGRHSNAAGPRAAKASSRDGQAPQLVEPGDDNTDMGDGTPTDAQDDSIPDPPAPPATFMRRMLGATVGTLALLSPGWLARAPAPTILETAGDVETDQADGGDTRTDRSAGQGEAGRGVDTSHAPGTQYEADAAAPPPQLGPTAAEPGSLDPTELSPVTIPARVGDLVAARQASFTHTWHRAWIVRVTTHGSRAVHTVQ